MWPDEHLLDNPMWHAMSGNQAKYALGGSNAKRFPADTILFSAFPDPSAPDWDAYAGICHEGDVLLLHVLHAPVDGRFKVVYTAPAEQYIFRGEPVIEQRDHDMVALTLEDFSDIEKLVNDTHMIPPVKKPMLAMGAFYGIRSEGRLVSMACERLHCGRFREIAAVYTLAEYMGQGMASRLTRRLVADICNRGEVPFLHVMVANTRAISLYKRLGFVHRATTDIVIVQYSPEKTHSS